MTIESIYELNKITDDPRFEGFALEEVPSLLGRESILDDLNPGHEITSSSWRPPSLVDRWIAPHVVGRVSEDNDYPCVNLLIPAFSERAISHLDEMLRENGELLPLKAETKAAYFIYNLLTVSDALDHSESLIDAWDDNHVIAYIDWYAFKKDKIQGLSIFMLRECPGNVFVTNAFVKRVDAAGLKGFAFTKVWPLPKGSYSFTQSPLKYT